MSKLKELAEIQAQSDFEKGIFDPHRDGGKRYAEHYENAWYACQEAEEEGREEIDLEYFLNVA